MPIVSGGGGGAAFNGGTITQPLTVTLGSDVAGITVRQPTGAQAAGITVTGYTGVVGDSGAEVYAAGSVAAEQRDTSFTPLAAFGKTGTLVPLAQMFDGASKEVFTVGKDGAPITAQNAAPADAELAAGQCALWFDQTNAAAKLMLKGKTANGTVVAASIALA